MVNILTKEKEERRNTILQMLQGKSTYRMKLEHIARMTGVSTGTAKTDVDYLMEQGLVRREKVLNKFVYFSTEKEEEEEDDVDRHY